jgi:hypothetical protein
MRSTAGLHMGSAVYLLERRTAAPLNVVPIALPLFRTSGARGRRSAWDLTVELIFWMNEKRTFNPDSG